jgi:hypothetical protein
MSSALIMTTSHASAPIGEEPSLHVRGQSAERKLQRREPLQIGRIVELARRDGLFDQLSLRQRLSRELPLRADRREGDPLRGSSRQHVRQELLGERAVSFAGPSGKH